MHEDTPQAVENYPSGSFPVTSRFRLSLLPRLGSSHAVELTQRGKKKGNSPVIGYIISVKVKRAFLESGFWKSQAAEFQRLSHWSLRVSFLTHVITPHAIPSSFSSRRVLPMALLNAMDAFTHLVSPTH